MASLKIKNDLSEIIESLISLLERTYRPPEIYHNHKSLEKLNFNFPKNRPYFGHIFLDDGDALALRSPDVEYN